MNVEFREQISVQQKTVVEKIKFTTNQALRKNRYKMFFRWYITRKHTLKK